MVSREGKVGEEFFDFQGNLVKTYYVPAPLLELAAQDSLQGWLCL